MNITAISNIINIRIDTFCAEFPIQLSSKGVNGVKAYLNTHEKGEVEREW